LIRLELFEPITNPVVLPTLTVRYFLGHSESSVVLKVVFEIFLNFPPIVIYTHNARAVFRKRHINKLILTTLHICTRGGL